MVTEDKPVSLTNLAGGAAVEKFDAELKKILANIMDPNARPGKRQIVLTVSILKNPDNDLCEVEISCVPKPQPAKSFSVAAIIGQDERGGTELREIKSAAQCPLFDGGKVTPLRKEGIND